MSDSVQPHRWQPTRPLCPWDSPGKNTGVGCHFLLQGIFPTQGSNPGLLHCKQMLYPLSHQGSPLGISNFLEDISSLSHSIVCLYFFALITEEGFLISLYSSLELCIQTGISFLFSFAFGVSSFSQLLVRPPQTTILHFCISFSFFYISM